LYEYVCCIPAVRHKLRFCTFTTIVIFNISSMVLSVYIVSLSLSLSHTHTHTHTHTHPVCIVDPKNNLNRTAYCLNIFYHTTFQASCNFDDSSVIPIKEVFTATKDNVLPYVLCKCQILRVNRILILLLSVATVYKMIAVENSSVLFSVCFSSFLFLCTCEFSFVSYSSKFYTKS